MKIAIGNDRNGIEYKKRLTVHLESLGHTVINCGTDDNIPADYPVHGERVGRAVASGECQRGIVICATGIGIAISADKVKGVRAGLAYTDDVARLMRVHNDANVIAFGQSQMKYEEENRYLSQNGICRGVSFNTNSTNKRYRKQSLHYTDAYHK